MAVIPAEPSCLACQTLAGTISVPGGLILETDYWAADHCMGAFGVGSIVVKTKAHRPNLWELTVEESASLGEVLKTLSGAMVRALGAERVYISLWVDQPPYHVHFVLQPRYPEPTEDGLKGWRLQQARLQQGSPNPQQMAEAAKKIRTYLQSSLQSSLQSYC
ncbi:MAG: diadenosine tetraphosphate hydrolase [Leptolyngbyaceae cyanobacterium CRU_2_3]|nr:diadenosine tetraphosphate hydrolase [Leptolyngbyaceae cyanobacterium CRU_2_3]